MHTSRGARNGFFFFLFFSFYTHAQPSDQDHASDLKAGRAAAVESFVAGSYRSPSGEAMAYRLFVPPDYDAAKKYPIVLWLHGAAGF